MASTAPTASFAVQSTSERSLLITEAAARLGLAELILEKDFWVGWLLGRMFAMPGTAGQFLFKGGTSLSMVFGAVRRFSEDIDLAILPAALGFDESYFNEAPSANQRRKRMLELAQASEAFVPSANGSKPGSMPLPGIALDRISCTRSASICPDCRPRCAMTTKRPNDSTC